MSQAAKGFLSRVNTTGHEIEELNRRSQEENEEEEKNERGKEKRKKKES